MGAPFSFIGAADAYVDVLTDEGVRTGLELKGNCTNFTPKPDSERLEQTANGRSNYGQVLASVTIPKPMTAKITFNQLDQALFAAAFFGTNSEFTQAAGSISTAIVVTSIPDRWVEIGKLMVSNLVVKNEAEDATYDVANHFLINERLGMIKAISGASGGIADGAVLHITAGDFAEIAGTQMNAMTKSNVRIRVKMDGKNFADGRNFITDVYQMRLSPTSEFSYVGTQFVDVTFEGSLETPTGFDEPMKHIWLS